MDAIILSAPTPFGNVASQMKKLPRPTGRIMGLGKLAGKLVSPMSSAQNVNGGQEYMVKTLYTTAMHWG